MQEQVEGEGEAMSMPKPKKKKKRNRRGDEGNAGAAAEDGAAGTAQANDALPSIFEAPKTGQIMEVLNSGRDQEAADGTAPQ